MDQIKPRVYTDAQGRICTDTTLPWYVLNPFEGSLLEYAGPLLIVENKVMRIKDNLELDASEWIYRFALGVTEHEWKKGEGTPLASLIEARVTNCIGYRPISEVAPQATELVAEQQRKPKRGLQNHLLAMDLTTGTNYHIRELALHAK